MGAGRARKKRSASLRKQQLKAEQERTLAVPRVSGWRLWLFRIAALTLVPALLLLMAEMCLRAFGFGYPTSAIVKCEINGRNAYRNNIKFGWRFFPKNIARELVGFVFSKNKSRHGYRIFVLGESAALGVPDHAYGFWQILKVMLTDRYPGVDFEVVIAAMPAINSHAILPIAKDCAKHEPDLFIVYAGNNEVVGPFGAGTVFSPVSPSLSAIRTSIAIKSTRLGQLLEAVLSGISSNKKALKRWNGLEMFLDKQVRYDSLQLQHVCSHFKQNLIDICKAGTDAGAKVIVCSVASNLKDSPPFASLHREDLTEEEKNNWQRIYQQGIENEQKQNYSQAVHHYLTAVEIDDAYADLHFRLGRCYWAMSKYDLAKQSYIQARQFDTLRFRPDERINEIIREVARDKTDEGIYFVDIMEVFEQNSPHRTPGAELFCEHVHCNFSGNYLLARTVFSQIEKLLPEHIAKSKDESVFLSEEHCAKRLAYTGWDRLLIARNVLDKFVKKPPFTNQLYHDSTVEQLERELDELQVYAQPSGQEQVLAEYEQAIKESPDDWFLHSKYGDFLFYGLKMGEQAEAQYRKSNQYLPNYITFFKLGKVMHSRGRIDEYIRYLNESLEMKPTFSKAHFALGYVLGEMGNRREAIEYFQQGLAIAPVSYTDAYIVLAKLFYDSGKTHKAFETLQRAIEVFPKEDTGALHYGLAYMLNQKGETGEAIDELHKVLEIQPDHAEAKKRLEQLLNTKTN